MKQKSQTKDLSKGLPEPIPAGQNEKKRAEEERRPDNGQGHEDSCQHDTPKNDELRNEMAVDENAQNTLERIEADFLKLVKEKQAEMVNQCLEKCEFTCRYGDNKWCVDIYREECP